MMKTFDSAPSDAVSSVSPCATENSCTRGPAANCITHTLRSRRDTSTEHNRLDHIHLLHSDSSTRRRTRPGTTPRSSVASLCVHSQPYQFTGTCAHACSMLRSLDVTKQPSQPGRIHARHHGLRSERALIDWSCTLATMQRADLRT